MLKNLDLIIVSFCDNQLLKGTQQDRLVMELAQSFHSHHVVKKRDDLRMYKQASDYKDKFAHKYKNT